MHKTISRLYWISFIFICSQYLLFSQENRPIPYPVFQDPVFNNAVQHQTRTHRGLPGEAYWTNFSKYNIEAQLSVDLARLTGQARIVYFNNSPDSLDRIVIQLYQNLNKAGSRKLREVQTTEGMQISSVKVNGKACIETGYHHRYGYNIRDTQMTILLEKALLPGKSIGLEIHWHFQIPKSPNPRMGHDSEVFFLAYWYPQIAVYDDLQGWDYDKYLGGGEFYMGYADYDVKITVPDQILIGATGELVNANEILSPQSLKRLEQAWISENIVSIIDFQDLQQNKGILKAEDHQHTWHFKAQNVRDFAFGASEHYVWDACYAEVDQSNGKRSLIHAMYRPERKYWKQAAHYGQHAMEYLSDHLWPYPWSQMTLIEGLIGGGMEYPMITLIGVDSNPYNLYSVIAHEIGHMWFPMMVGTDEKAYCWIDEGLTRFQQNHSLSKYYPEIDPWDPWSGKISSYYSYANSGFELPSMRHRDQYPINNRSGNNASYAKPAIGLRALSAVYGEETIQLALREFGKRWKYKHPVPFDFFNSVEDVLGEELDWFWTSWFYNTWTLDHAIEKVEVKADSNIIYFEDKGLLPFPLIAELHFDNDSTARVTIPVSHWLDDHRHFKLIHTDNPIKMVIIDPEKLLPDLDRSNNIWIRKNDD